MKRTFICLIITILAANAIAQNKATVIAYNAAPGQFVNVMPKFTEGADSVAMARIADGSTAISLGAYGGHIILRFEEPVANVKGEYDLYIKGNAHSNGAEPGIVMVSADANGNGLPDDEWYELAGSEYDNSIKNYSITYYRPTDDTPEQEHIRWKDNRGESGFISRNSYHKQPYYPQWATADSLTFSGTLLPDNAESVGATYVLKSFDWGYADNHANTNREKCSFKIEWAVDNNGENAEIEQIDFVKIYTGINKVNGWVGECSTEFTGIEDLHSTPTQISEKKQEYGLQVSQFGNTVLFISDKQVDATIFNIAGNRIERHKFDAGENTLNLNHLPIGVYIIKTIYKDSVSIHKIMITR
jgi:hypothetical protein